MPTLSVLRFILHIHLINSGQVILQHIARTRKHEDQHRC